MSWVWEHAKAEGAEMLVLLSLADHASDEGTCYPSMTRIAERARLSLRGAQTAMRSLEARGIIRTELNAGPKGCNRYTVQMLHPADVAPRKECTPADNDRGGANGGIKPPQHLHPNRNEPSLNRNTPQPPLQGGRPLRKSEARKLVAASVGMAPASGRLADDPEVRRVAVDLARKRRGRDPTGWRKGTDLWIQRELDAEGPDLSGRELERTEEA